MKIEYFPVDPSRNRGPWYVLRAENKVEQRFLTILRDEMLGDPIRLRMIGSENMENDVPGMPPRPALAASFCLEGIDGKVPEKFQKGTSHLDASKVTPKHDGIPPKAVVSSGRKGMKVVRQKHSKAGPTTVIEENLSK